MTAPFSRLFDAVDLAGQLRDDGDLDVEEDARAAVRNSESHLVEEHDHRRAHAGLLTQHAGTPRRLCGSVSPDVLVENSGP